MLIKAEKKQRLSCFSKANRRGTRRKRKDSLKIILLLVLFRRTDDLYFCTMTMRSPYTTQNGTVNIGQLARILLALSGLMAGFLFDIAAKIYECDHVLRNASVYDLPCHYSVCRAIHGGSGQFYLSAGFFAVFFTSSFMEIGPIHGYTGVMVRVCISRQ